MQSLTKPLLHSILRQRCWGFTESLWLKSSYWAAVHWSACISFISNLKRIVRPWHFPLCPFWCSRQFPPEITLQGAPRYLPWSHSLVTNLYFSGILTMSISNIYQLFCFFTGKWQYWQGIHFRRPSGSGCALFRRGSISKQLVMSASHTLVTDFHLYQSLVVFVPSWWVVALVGLVALMGLLALMQ